jgi:D-lactate dehydrogenase
LRRENHSSFSNNIALFIAKNFGLVERTTRFALKAGTGFNKIAGKKGDASINKRNTENHSHPFHYGQNN